MENKRYKETPPLLEGERVVAYRQGGYLSSRSWKLGHFYLTNERLLFRQVKRLILDIPLEDIAGVGFRKRPFILATKTCMLLLYRGGATHEPREAIIITPRLHSWWERIAGLLSERGVELPMQGLLTKSDLGQARRERVRSILDRIKAEEKAEDELRVRLEAEGVEEEEIGPKIADARLARVRERMKRAKTGETVRRQVAQPMEGSGEAKAIGRSGWNHVQLGELLAELEAEEGGRAWRGGARKRTVGGGRLDQARKDRAQGKTPGGEAEEALKVRIDRARDRALATMRGEATTQDPQNTGPWESDVAQERRDRVREILTEIHGDLPERIEEERLAKVAQPLDPASGEIIWYLWENRHAKIEELRQLLGESSHMNALTRIKEVINPMAHKVLGRPLLVFERSRIDHITGQTVLYSWWLCKEAERRPAEDGRSIDVLDETDHIMVVVELGGIREEEIQVGIEGRKLIVLADTPDQRCREEISLPSAADAKRFVTRYHNNVLQVRFEKVPQAELVDGGLQLLSSPAKSPFRARDARGALEG